MSTPLGVLNLSGRGGQELFVFTDCVVHATTGLTVALSQIAGGSSDTGRLLGALTGSRQRYADMAPELIATESPGNRLYRFSAVTSATLSRGRWPSRQLTFTLTLEGGEVAAFRWPGNGATRPLNHDAYAIELLTTALGPKLENTLT